MIPVEEREELNIFLAEGPDDRVLVLDDPLDVQEPDETTSITSGGGGRDFQH